MSAYAYNLAGQLTEQTYPSGRVVRNVFDAYGDLSQVLSRKNQSSGVHAYASQFAYNAAGAVTSMRLGSGRWESTQFNSRLQPTRIALGSVHGATDLLKLDYGYSCSSFGVPKTFRLSEEFSKWRRLPQTRVSSIVTRSGSI